MKRRVTVVDCSGFIGRRLSVRLRDDGAAGIVLSRMPIEAQARPSTSPAASTMRRGWHARSTALDLRPRPLAADLQQFARPQRR